jgi:predicted ATPase
LIIESHSEHLLTRLQRRIAENIISKEDVAIYFVKRTGSAAEIELLQLNEDGEIENWPENFFGDEMADVAARMKAAMMRPKRAASTSPKGN